MSILYDDEHRNCVNYQVSEKALIELKKMDQMTGYEGNTIESELVYVAAGEVIYTSDAKVKTTVLERQMIFVPSGQWFSYQPNTDSRLVVFRLGMPKIRFCASYSLTDLLTQIKVVSHENTQKTYCMKSEQIVRRYMDLLQIYLEQGVRCHSFFESKTKELFFLLRSFYPKEVLAQLFEPAERMDTAFSTQVITNSHKYKTMSDLALSMNYTVSGFEKRFKRVFGVSGYHWMKLQKARRILTQIAQGEKSLKDISDDFGFPTQARFNDFCKDNFGKPPGKIRQNHMIGGNWVNKGG